jgi:hypothetical protein
VGQHLIEKGPQTLNSIISHTKLEYKDVREAVMVLIQHNIVSFIDEEEVKKRQEEIEDPEKKKDEYGGTISSSTKKTYGKNQPLIVSSEFTFLDMRPEEWKEKNAKEKESEKPTKKTLYYLIDVDAILVSLRTSKFLLLSKSLFGEEGELLLSSLLTHGRLSLHDSLEYTLQLYHEKNKNTGTGDDWDHKLAHEEWVDVANDRSVKKKIQEAFDNMVKSRFIKRVEDINADGKYRSYNS